jgi:hypothetical protein
VTHNGERQPHALANIDRSRSDQYVIRMLKGSKSYSISGGNSVAFIIAGIVFLGIGWGVWTSNVPASTGDWVMMVLFELFFVGLGLLFLGFRMKFTVYPEQRECSRERFFFGLRFGRKSWKFSEFSGVDVSVRIGRKGARSARVTLTPKAGGDPVVVNVFMMLGGLPPAAVEAGHELSETMGLPLSKP